MFELPIILWPSLGVAKIFGFLFHILAIWVGFKAADIKKTGFIQLAIITLISYVILAITHFLLWPLGLILFGLFSFLAAALSVAVATKLIIDTDWGKAWTVGFIAAVVYVVLAMILN